MRHIGAVLVGGLLWLLAFWAVYEAAAGAPDHAPPPPAIRTISILSGPAVRFVVSSAFDRVTLDLMMRVEPGDYEQLPAFRRCRDGCRLRVYIVQERR